VSFLRKQESSISASLLVGEAGGGEAEAGRGGPVLLLPRMRESRKYSRVPPYPAATP